MTGSQDQSKMLEEHGKPKGPGVGSTGRPQGHDAASAEAQAETPEARRTTAKSEKP